MQNAIYCWLWFGVGIGIAADYWEEYKERSGVWTLVLLCIIGPVFFPIIVGRAICKLNKEEIGEF